MRTRPPIRLLAGDMDNAADDADQDLDDLLQPEAGGAPDDEKRLDLVSTLVAAARVAAARVAAALEEEPADCLFSSPPPAHHLEGKAGPRRAFTPAPVSLTPTSSAGPTTAVRVRNKSQPAKKTQKKRKKRKNPNRPLFRQMRDRRAVVTFHARPSISPTKPSQLKTQNARCGY